jgi:hypothetical protein
MTTACTEASAALPLNGTGPSASTAHAGSRAWRVASSIRIAR